MKYEASGTMSLNNNTDTPQTIEMMQGLCKIPVSERFIKLASSLWSEYALKAMTAKILNKGMMKIEASEISDDILSNIAGSVKNIVASGMPI